MLRARVACFVAAALPRCSVFCHPGKIPYHDLYDPLQNNTYVAHNQGGYVTFKVSLGTKFTREFSTSIFAFSIYGGCNALLGGP